MLYRLLALTTGISAALLANMPMATAQPACTGASTALCLIALDEMVAGVPLALRVTLGLDMTDEPVSVPRQALIWPGDGSFSEPPVVIFHGGHGSFAAGNAAALQLETIWPQAIILYLEANRLVDHSGQFRDWGDSSLGDTEWSPRFPHRLPGAQHDDLDYLDRMLEEMATLFPHDPTRIYAAGHSSGGFFTLSLTELRPEVFRAFAMLGTFADFGALGNDIDEIEAAGRVRHPRPVLYMMGDRENEFLWQPAQAAGDDKAHRTVRQLTARNGSQSPADTDYLDDMVNEVRGAAPADRFATRHFAPALPGGTETVMGVYGGDHSWPPRDADDPSLSAAEWVVAFFQSHAEPIDETLFEAWMVPALLPPLPQ